ncbi:polyphenol oxidase YfiH [Gammaproteobacteria bacterium]
MTIDWIEPNWPAPRQVRALTTTRRGGVSRGSYSGLNLATHVGDDPAAVAHNRQLLRTALALHVEPCWLEQAHGIHAVDACIESITSCPADASYAHSPGAICAVLTADCLPVLFCDHAGTCVAAAHAGWRGLLAGVLERTVTMLGVAPGELMAWLGPAIGPQTFEVGEEVKTAFFDADAGAALAFQPSPRGRWFADLYQLARRRLTLLGVGAVHGGDLCTFSDSQRFYSYRREATCGRMASLIWLVANPS